MFKSFEKFKDSKKNIKADVIILGCTLPGIVAAHKLKASLGDTVEIVVLDLPLPIKPVSRCNYIGFQEDVHLDDSVEGSHPQNCSNAQQYILTYSKELQIPVPDIVCLPDEGYELLKLFEDQRGHTVQCYKNFHDFEYLGYLERFELNQYHNILDQNMKNLFHTKEVNDWAEQYKLRSYDQTSMEKHICSHLFFAASRSVMASTVKLVCGAPASEVSVLFYLHQCYRNSSVKNHLDGNNFKFREKILGYCRKRLEAKLQQSIADITLKAKSIVEIRTNSNQQVILESLNKDTSYVCKLLAMALPPEALHTIRVEAELLSAEEIAAVTTMQLNRILKFVVKYEENFWRRNGFSGDIFSIKGPIVWAMELPKFAASGSSTTLVGFLEINNHVEDSKQAVIDQLVKLFGENAASPVSYMETDIRNVYVPKCGDYITFIKMSKHARKLHLFSALDIYADGDLAGALEAGHNVYLNVLRVFRPQAIDYHDAQLVERPIVLEQDPITRFICRSNLMTGFYVLAAASTTIVCVAVILSFRK